MPAAKRGESGFTLLELMVALGIAVILLATAPFAVVRAYETMEYRSTVKEVLAGLKSARLDAMRKGRSVAFMVDMEQRRFGVESRLDHAFPEQLDVRLVLADIEIQGSSGGIRFYPDGSSTGGAVELIRPSGSGVRVDVDWLLGRLSQTVLDER
ncbi:GspH/FimT family pseudopilin [Thauera butanivorans]|uniref:GspH/FimT family pseudopilin n=1 Tax=Thauera butanivorans TaxID=86174 RepID=UPI0008386808|nr:GspH/FimT family pseudopilin [Thauera butanivorans]